MRDVSENWKYCYFLSEVNWPRWAAENTHIVPVLINPVYFWRRSLAGAFLVPFVDSAWTEVLSHCGTVNACSQRMNWTDLTCKKSTQLSYTRRVHWPRASRSVTTSLAAAKLGRFVLIHFARCEHSHWSTRVQNWSSVHVLWTNPNGTSEWTIFIVSSKVTGPYGWYIMCIMIVVLWLCFRTLTIFNKNDKYTWKYKGR